MYVHLPVVPFVIQNYLPFPYISYAHSLTPLVLTQREHSCRYFHCSIKTLYRFHIRYRRDSPRNQSVSAAKSQSSVSTIVKTVSLHHCLLCHFTTISIITSPLSLSSLHHCLCRHFTAVSIVTSLPSLSSLHHCLLCHFTTITIITSLPSLSSLHCCLHRHFTAVSVITSPPSLSSLHHRLHCHFTTISIVTSLPLLSSLPSPSKIINPAQGLLLKLHPPPL
jgi:hypothetical protein